MTTTRRILVLLIGYIPLLHAAACIAIWFIPQSIAVRASVFVVALYVVPPLAARLGRFEPGTYPMHIGWWWSQQWQTLFNRFSFLEEVLRLLPSVNTMGLRVSASHIGRLAYWAPAVAIVNRGLVDIGESAVIGAGVRIGSHLFTNDELLIARVTIGANAVIGAFSILAPGVIIGESESTPAALLLPPHSEWRGDRRVPRRSRNAV